MYDRLFSRNSITSKALAILPSYKVFREKYTFLQKSQWWSREQLEEYQLQQLGKVLKHPMRMCHCRKVFSCL